MGCGASRPKGTPPGFAGHAVVGGTYMTGLIEDMRRLLHDDQGVTAVEYAVMLALIVVALISTINGLGATTLDYFERDAAEIGAALDGL